MERKNILGEEPTEQYKLWVWIKAHKKQLIAAGISITVLIGIILGLKNKNSLLEIWDALHKSIEDTAPALEKNTLSVKSIVPTEVIDITSVKVDRAPFDVRSHLRNLPEGMNASIEKVRTALEHGYELQPGQTWVESYTKGTKVA